MYIKIWKKMPIGSTNVSLYAFAMAQIKIKEIMKQRGIKPKDLVENVPFSRSTIYRILSGQKNPTIDDLEEFARELDVPLEDLYVSKFSKTTENPQKTSDLKPTRNQTLTNPKPNVNDNDNVNENVNKRD